jgi:preprotein translocase subunit SecF
MNAPDASSDGQPAGTTRSALAGLWHRLYHGRTSFDFIGRRRIGFAISALVIVATLLSLFTRGLNLGIDFEGGVSWEFPANEVSTDDARGILDDNGIASVEAKIQTLSGPDGDRLRVQVGDQPQETRLAVQQAFAEAAGLDINDVSVTTVSATWGSQITEKAVRALIVFIALLAVYISWRFEWRMAVAAIVAMLHDVLVAVGIYSIIGFEVTPATVIAFLTILGFSLYDTIVVFDKVYENHKRFGGGRFNYSDVVNLSMNQVLMRSINTSIAALLPVVSVLVVGSRIMGAVALEDFALALLIGLAAGTYSSIFIAAPLLAMLKMRDPAERVAKHHGSAAEEMARMRSLGGVATKEAAARVSAPVAAASAAGGAGATAAGARPASVRASSDPTVVLSHPPRPRKQRRK